MASRAHFALLTVARKTRKGAPHTFTFVLKSFPSSFSLT
jgi:hypothetical protein